jgi:hypothetical protein
MKTTHIVMILGAAGTLVGVLARHRPDSGVSGGAEGGQESGRVGRKVVARGRRVPSFVRPETLPPRLAPVAEEGRTTTEMDAFDAESRDPAWAAAMENTLARRFDPGSVPPWLASMNLETMECHAHSCRMVVSYPAELTRLASDRGVGQASAAQTPLDHLVRETGPVAGGTSVVSTESTSESDGSTSVRVTAVLAFGPDDSNPASYPDWVSSQLPQTDPLSQPRD